MTPQQSHWHSFWSVPKKGIAQIKILIEKNEDHHTHQKCMQKQNQMAKKSLSALTHSRDSHNARFSHI